MGNLRSQVFRTLLTLTVFSIAMGFLESAVVVYLRQIYYPDGFGFPLRPLPASALGIEIAREVSTLIMLWAIGVAAGRNFLQRFSFFLYSFGVWDIFYYLWLKVLLDWPPSLLSWDILFLIPVAWAGPVLAPVIVSLTMILLAGCILSAEGRGLPGRMTAFEWTALLSGALVIVTAFVSDYGRIVIGAPGFQGIGADGQLSGAFAHHVPSDFQWGLFLLGEVLVLSSLGSIWKRTRSVRGLMQKG